MAKFARKKRSAIALQSAESIDYSVQMRKNPMNDNDPERAYPTLQYAGTVKLEQLASHITTHGSPYTRDMIIGVVTAVVDCIREHVTRGFKVELSDLGTFKLSINSKGAESLETFNPTSNITDAYVEYEPGGYFVDLKNEIQFNQVVNRTIQAAAMKAFGPSCVNLSTRLRVSARAVSTRLRVSGAAMLTCPLVNVLAACVNLLTC